MEKTITDDYHGWTIRKEYSDVTGSLIGFIAYKNHRKPIYHFGISFDAIKRKIREHEKKHSS